TPLRRLRPARTPEPERPAGGNTLRQERAGAPHGIVTAKSRDWSQTMKQFLAPCLALLLVTFALPATAQVDRDDPAYRWNLEHLFPSLEAWEAERQRILGELERIATFKGSLGNSSASLYEA